MKESNEEQHIFVIEEKASCEVEQPVDWEEKPQLAIEVEVSDKAGEQTTEDGEPPTTTEASGAIDAVYVADILDQINKKYDEKIAVDAHKNLLFDKMYSELQQLKADPYKKTLKPIFMDLIMYIDSIRLLASKYPELPADDSLLPFYQKLRSEFAKTGGHIEDILYNHGIESFCVDAGSEFDARTQQAKKTTTVTTEEDNKKVIESLSPGYYWDGQLLRKESVHVGIKENINN